jgi:hypothetical protein
MLQITFGEIDSGCAQTQFDTGDQQIGVQISFFTDPFAELAELALAMLRGEPEAQMRFTDEPGDYRLIARRCEKGYSLRLEQWMYFFNAPATANQLEKIHFEVSEVDPPTFALQLCIELQRIASFPGVIRWYLSTDEHGDPIADTTERELKIAELEAALMAPDPP